MSWRTVLAVILSVITFGLIVWVLSYLPTLGLAAKEFVFEQFRQVIWREYGIIIVLISMITSIVLIVSVFAMRIAEIAEAEGGEG